MSVKIDSSQKIVSQRVGISNMKFPSMTIIAGVTESGKTSLLRAIVKKYAPEGHWNQVIALCPTALLQAQAYGFLDSKSIITEPKETDIQKIMDQQKANKTTYINSPAKQNKVLLILDDIVGVMRTHNSDIFAKLATSGRQYNISTIILTQDLKAMSPAIRMNTYYMYITKIRDTSIDSAHKFAIGMGSERDMERFLERNCKVREQYVRLNGTAETATAVIVFRSRLVKNFTVS